MQSSYRLLSYEVRWRDEERVDAKDFLNDLHALLDQSVAHSQLASIGSLAATIVSVGI